MIRGLLAVIGGIALIAFVLAQCGVPIPGTQPIVGPPPGTGGRVVATATAPGAQQTAAPGAPAATPPSTVYVGIPPENAPAGPAPASNIGTAMIDGNVYQFDGGAQRWLGMWQTGKPQSPLMQGVPFQANTKVSCQSPGWVVFVDAVSFAMGGNSFWSSNPQIAEIACPFEETRFTLVDGQVGVVPHEWVDWAWHNRIVGFERASGHTSSGRRVRINGNQLTKVG